MIENETKLVSLGNWCNSRANINYYLHPELDCMKTSNHDSGLFDWVFICDYNNICDLFNNNFYDLFNISNLIVLKNMKNSIYDTKYKIIYNHLYKENELLSENILLTKYNTYNEKMQYLKNKFIKLSNYKTIYIITLSKHNWIDSNIAPIIPTIDTLINLRNSLINIRNNNNFILLIIYNKTDKFDFKNYENIMFHSIDEIGFFMMKKQSNSFNELIKSIFN